MRDVLGTLREWYDGGTPFALATVFEVRRSAPRQPGAVMAVDASGTVVGSVSGGCVEGAVYDIAQQVLTSGHPRLETYGISDDEAFAVGLTCGGIISVFMERILSDEVPQLSGVLAALASDEPVAVATAVDGPARGKLAVWPDRVDGTLGRGGLDAAVTDDARGLLAQGLTEMRHYGPNGERRQDAASVFVESFAPPRRGCTSSAPSTMPPRSRGSGPSSATTSWSATLARSSRPPPGSPTPRRSSSAGRTGFSPPRRSMIAR